MTPNRINYFDEFNSAEHFKGDVKWDEIKDLTGSDFLWEVLEPMSIMVADEDHEEERAKRLSPGQKALYFFWYLDAQVTNGGFIQFYWNGYDFYLPSIKKGLELMDYNELLNVVVNSENEYDKHSDKFEECGEKDNSQWLYKNLNEFDKLDDWYFSRTGEHYSIIEKFVRENIDEFIIKTE